MKEMNDYEKNRIKYHSNKYYNKNSTSEKINF